MHANGQVSGVGRGLITGSHNVGLGPLYMDNTRTQILGISATGPSTFSILTNSAAGFSVNDMVLIFQMTGTTNVGHHQNAIISAIVSNTITATTVSGTIVTFSAASPTSKLQLIKINEYSNFTLTDGEITCHEWDGATGGVICFLVSGTFNVDGGVVNAAGKGFYPDGVTSWGLGGAGAAPSTVAGGGYAAPSNLLVGCTATLSVGGPNRGTSGGAANNAVAAGSSNVPANPASLIYNPGSPSFFGTAVMGKAGYYPNNAGAGDGAGGGGQGGTGGQDFCATPGVPGNSGETGEAGGDAGQGARSGGIIIIKTTTITRGSGVSSSTKLFSVKGQDGDAGRAGGNGGMGGQGGDGGPGQCVGGVILCNPGGPGGWGSTGDPGDGGDGSNGGYPGTVWIATRNTTNLSGGNLDVRGGAGGYAGPGGYSWINPSISLPATYVDDPCTGRCLNPCTGMRIIPYCDANQAFCHLRQAVSFSMHIAGTHGIASGYDFWDAGANLVAIYDLTKNELNGIEFDIPHCQEIHYLATFYGGSECSNIFRKMAHLLASSTGQISNLNNTSDGGTCGYLPIAPTIHFKDNSNFDMFIYHGSDRYIEDMSEPGHPRCYVGSCYESTPVNSGDDGAQGDAAPDGVAEDPFPAPLNPSDNGIIEFNATWKRALEIESITDNVNGLRLYPQPAANQVNLVLQHPYTGDITMNLYDISGKLVRTWKEKSSADQLEINISLSDFSKGVYLLKVEMGSRTSQLRLTIE